MTKRQCRREKSNLLTGRELTDRIVEKGAGGPNQVRHVLKALAEVVEEEVSAGGSVSIRGVAKIQWRYIPARKKGESYKKGEEYNSFGTMKIAEQDSPARKQSIKLTASTPSNLAPLKKDEAVMKKAIKKAKK